MGAAIMKSFWESRIDGWTSSHSKSLLVWDVLRALAFIAFFALGWIANTYLLSSEPNGSLRFFVAVTTFGTFLASFVMTLMTAVGKRELDVQESAASVRNTEERLRWLVSDQLVMVVTALAAAGSSLLWLGIHAVSGQTFAPLTAIVFAFAALALLNALRLPFQIWEFQSSALADERERAIKRLNKENEERLAKDRAAFTGSSPASSSTDVTRP